jgi:hypothetical protein
MRAGFNLNPDELRKNSLAVVMVLRFRNKLVLLPWIKGFSAALGLL